MRRLLTWFRNVFRRRPRPVEPPPSSIIDAWAYVARLEKARREREGEG